LPLRVALLECVAARLLKGCGRLGKTLRPCEIVHDRFHGMRTEVPMRILPVALGAALLAAPALA
jgi:hypothetical protein